MKIFVLAAFVAAISIPAFAQERRLDMDSHKTVETLKKEAHTTPGVDATVLPQKEANQAPDIYVMKTLFGVVPLRDMQAVAGMTEGMHLSCVFYETAEGDAWLDNCVRRAFTQR